MRTIGLFLLLFTLAPGVWADTPDDLGTIGADEYFYVGFGGSLDIPTQGHPHYTLGGGGEAIVGYGMGDHFSTQLTIDNFYFYGLNNLTIADFRPTLEIKAGMDLKEFFLPYFFFGPGLDIEYDSANGVTSSDVNALGVIGLGVQFDLGDRIQVFLEGKYNFIFQNTSVDKTGGLVEDVPLETGLTFGL